MVQNKAYGFGPVGVGDHGNRAVCNGVVGALILRIQRIREGEVAVCRLIREGICRYAPRAVARQACYEGVDCTHKLSRELSDVGDVKLLCRLYDPTEGCILLDGVDIREYDYDGYMAQFSTVFQDYRLFSMSLRDNVALTLPADDHRVELLLRQVGMGPRLDSLPKGIHTHVTKLFEEDGFEPSGGEGQKIALARALYREAPIVVLDEPAAALDPRAEYELYRQFAALVAGKSAVYISHRMSSARFCDRVAIFSKGRLAELDTHDALMARGGEYAQLFALQAQYYG